MKKFRPIMRLWVKILAELVLVVAAVNLLVDPYEVFGTPRIAGISLIKPIARKNILLAKTFEVARAHPATVLIGSTSVHRGVDPISPAWPAAMGPVYDYGIPGAKGPTLSLRTLQEAITTGGVKNAVVFIDFRDFLGSGSPGPDLSRDERRFRLMPDGTPNQDSRSQRIKDMVRSLGTIEALIDSINTVILQRRFDESDIEPDGSGTEAALIGNAGASGMFPMFARNDAVQASRAAQAANNMKSFSGQLPGMDAVAAMAVFARSHDVALTLVIAPHHADAMELYWRAGLWPLVERLKTELTSLAAAGDGTVTVWDFLDYSSFNTESIPRSGDRRTPTSWFWDPVHFKKQLGEVMIQRMFGTDAPMFGIALTPANLTERNAGIRAERQTMVCEPTHSIRVWPDRDECSQTAKPATATSSSNRLDVSR